MYVYKALAHPEVNNYVGPINIEERLLHIAEAKRLSGTKIPWICDNMDGEIAKAFGGAPNGEYIIDPDGILLRKRFWSNPNTLRKDLEELIGAVEKPTEVADLDVVFRPETRDVASGVVPRITLPKGMVAVNSEPLDLDGSPAFAKLRVEMTPALKKDSKGQLYIGLNLDPIYKVHWNNRAGKIKIKIIAPDGVVVSPSELEGPEVKEDADVDPRMFLVNVENAPQGTEFEIEISYVACDDAESFCLPLVQSYFVWLETYKSGGTRPGIFLEDVFGGVAELDANGDSVISKDELPPGKASMFINHMDKNFDDIIDQEEIKSFMTMFHNGRGIPKKDEEPAPTETKGSESNKR